MEFSVIIPTRSRAHALAACLDSFLAIDFPADNWELIVVDDGGVDSFTAVNDAHHTRLPLQLIRQDAAGPATARNRGARQARGRWLAFTDDDCRVAPNWLGAWREGFARSRSQALGGRTLNPFPGCHAAAAAQWLVDFLQEQMRDAQGNQLLLLSNNVAYERVAFESAGGFDERFPLAAAEDLELSQRMVRAGYRQTLWPAAQVWHYHQMSLRRHVAQQFRYGRGNFYFERVRLVGDPSPKPASAKPFYWPMALALWQMKRPLPQWFILAAGQASFQVGRLWERRQQR